MFSRLGFSTTPRRTRKATVPKALTLPPRLQNAAGSKPALARFLRSEGRAAALRFGRKFSPPLPAVS